MPRISQRRRFRIDAPILPSHIGMAQDVQAFSISGHQAVLNTIVNHLDKVPCARWATVQIAVLGGAARFLSSRRAGNITTTRSESLEDGIETADYLRFAADHLTIAALHSPDAAARADIDIMNPL